MDVLPLSDRVAAHRDVKITHVLATEPAYAVNRRIRPLTLSRSAGDGVAAVLRRVLHVVGVAAAPRAMAVVRVEVRGRVGVQHDLVRGF